MKQDIMYQTEIYLILMNLLINVKSVMALSRQNAGIKPTVDVIL